MGDGGGGRRRRRRRPSSGPGCGSGSRLPARPRFSVSWPPPAPPPTLPVPARSWKPGAARRRNARRRWRRERRQGAARVPGGEREEIAREAGRAGGAGPEPEPEPELERALRGLRDPGPSCCWEGGPCRSRPRHRGARRAQRCARPGARTVAPERDGRCRGRLRRPAFPLGDAEAAPSCSEWAGAAPAAARAS